MRSSEKKPDFYYDEIINAPRSFVWDSILEQWEELREEDESLGELREGLYITKSLAGFSIAAALSSLQENKNLTFTMNSIELPLPLPIPLKAAEMSLELSDKEPNQSTRVAVLGNVALGGRFMPSLLVNKTKETIWSLAKPKVLEGLSDLKYATETAWDRQRGERAS